MRLRLLLLLLRPRLRLRLLLLPLLLARCGVRVASGEVADGAILGREAVRGEIVELHGRVAAALLQTLAVGLALTPCSACGGIGKAVWGYLGLLTASNFESPMRGVG